MMVRRIDTTGTVVFCGLMVGGGITLGLATLGNWTWVAFEAGILLGLAALVYAVEVLVDH